MLAVITSVPIIDIRAPFPAAFNGLFLTPTLPVRLPFWLLATFVDGRAPSANVVRCPHGSSKRFSTKSCVYSTS